MPEGMNRNSENIQLGKSWWGTRGPCPTSFVLIAVPETLDENRRNIGEVGR